MWEAIRTVHLVAMAFFVGGQLMLAAVVVPALRARGKENPIVNAAKRAAIRSAARRFGSGSVVALAVLAATGAAMAGHYGDWDRRTLHVKLALIVAIAGLIAAHARRPDRHALAAAVLVVSLAVVWLGTDLAHGG